LSLYSALSQPQLNLKMLKDKANEGQRANLEKLSVFKQIVAMI